MPLPTEFLERLKAANPIAEVMGDYVNLKRTGRDYICLCPFHNEKTPSCHVHPDREFFHCFGCGAGGDVITFTMKYHNLDYWEAVKLLAERGGVPLPEDNYQSDHTTEKRKRIYQMNKVSARFYFDKLRSPDGKVCRQYLKGRGLSPETIKKYGMGFAPNKWTTLKDFMLSEGFTEEEMLDASLLGRSQAGRTYDFFVNRAMFPFIDLRGNIVGFGGRALDSEDKRKYLNSKDTLAYQKNKFLFSMNFAKNSATTAKTIILCEGNLDVISLNQSGFEYAVASCGTALTPEQAKLISNYAEQVIICYDSDGAGQKATKRAIPILSEVGLKTTIIKMDGAKDPDEYINKFGALRFQHLLDNADGAINFELDKCRDGIDTDSDMGKIDYLKKAYQVLADIKSPVEREIYISKISREQGITMTAITEEINVIIRSNRRRAEKKAWHETASFTNVKRDPVNPQATQYPKEVKAEQGIIYYLFAHPDHCGDIMSLLPAENFCTDLNRRIYTSLCSKIKGGEDYSISSFNGEFSTDEMGNISAVLSFGDDKGITYSVVEDYIRTLNVRNSTNDIDISTDEGFLQHLSELHKKKS